MGIQIVHQKNDTLRVRIVRVSSLTQTAGEVLPGAPFAHQYLPPGGKRFKVMPHAFFSRQCLRRLLVVKQPDSAFLPVFHYGELRRPVPAFFGRTRRDSVIGKIEAPLVFLNPVLDEHTGFEQPLRRNQKLVDINRFFGILVIPLRVGLAVVFKQGDKPASVDGELVLGQEPCVNAIGNPPALPGDSKTLSFAGVLKYL
jgi:hypothetical protein